MSIFPPIKAARPRWRNEQRTSLRPWPANCQLPTPRPAVPLRSFRQLVHRTVTLTLRRCSSAVLLSRGGAQRPARPHRHARSRPARLVVTRSSRNPLVRAARTPSHLPTTFVSQPSKLALIMVRHTSTTQMWERQPASVFFAPRRFVRLPPPRRPSTGLRLPIFLTQLTVCPPSPLPRSCPDSPVPVPQL